MPPPGFPPGPGVAEAPSLALLEYLAPPPEPPAPPELFDGFPPPPPPPFTGTVSAPLKPPGPPLLPSPLG